MRASYPCARCQEHTFPDDICNSQQREFCGFINNHHQRNQCVHNCRSPVRRACQATCSGAFEQFYTHINRFYAMWWNIPWGRCNNANSFCPNSCRNQCLRGDSRCNDLCMVVCPEAYEQRNCHQKLRPETRRALYRERMTKRIARIRANQTFIRRLQRRENENIYQQTQIINRANIFSGVLRTEQNIYMRSERMLNRHRNRNRNFERTVRDRIQTYYLNMLNVNKEPTESILQMFS